MRNLKLLGLGHLVDDSLPPGLVLVLDEGEGEPDLGRVAPAGDLLDPTLQGSDVLGDLPVEDACNIGQA